MSLRLLTPLICFAPGVHRHRTLERADGGGADEGAAGAGGCSARAAPLPCGRGPQADQAFRLGSPTVFVLFFRLVLLWPVFASTSLIVTATLRQEYFAECRKQSLKPHKSVVDWIAACHLGICKILDGDPFSMLDLTVAAENAEGKTGPYYVPPEQLQAVLLAFGPVCGVADIQEVVLRGAIQSPAAALVAATMIEANSSIVSWDLSYN